ncbi:MAG: ABC transporter substrate-binding protein [Clostridium fessum]
MFDTLVTVDPETNEVVPQIAESWEQTDDQTYVFKIREGIKFHDGSDLTAEDVKFSLDRARNSAAVFLHC